jgi:hypothetical protein
VEKSPFEVDYAQRSQALRLLRIFKTGVNKYTENFERKKVNKKQKDYH